MKKLYFTLCGLALIFVGQAQSTVALENKPQALQERYYLMKTKAETYQDYKVIKESILDGVWKIVNDSLNKREKQLADAKVKIDTLQHNLGRAHAEVKSKNDSMADIVFASTHINVLGKNFSKSFFLVIFFTLFIGLALVITLLVARMKGMQSFVNESKLIVSSVNNELEDYKHKAMEKQVKLARELQTERNKLSDLLMQNKAPMQSVKRFDS
jgi:hypothetical protein